MSVVYIIGAGVSGLAAATRLAEAGIHTRLYEASSTAGGRARTMRDAQLGAVDNGLHRARGADGALLGYLTRIGARDTWVSEPAPLALPFAPAMDYAYCLYQLFTSHAHAAQLALAESPLFAEWVKPYARAILGQPETSVPANTLAQSLLRTVLPRNAGWLRPEQNLSESLVAPALDYLDEHGSSIYFSHALKEISYGDDQLPTLHFARKKLALEAEDVIILATPPEATVKLLPGTSAPQAAGPSITCHFQLTHREPHGTRALVDAPADLIAYREGRISLSCRVAEAHWHSAPEQYAARLWRWLQNTHPYLRMQKQPPHALIREKRAGHRLSAALPAPILPPRLLLAGDWLDATQPASLNQAATAGHKAAEAALKLIGTRPKQRKRESYF